MLSTLFISTDGNGQNPLPVAVGMLLVLAITGAVSFSLAWFIRTTSLSIVASIGITELVFLLYFVSRIAFSTHLDSHATEELCLLPLVFAVVTAPTILLSSIGFGRVASRVFQRKETELSGSDTQLGEPGITKDLPSAS